MPARAASTLHCLASDTKSGPQDLVPGDAADVRQQNGRICVIGYRTGDPVRSHVWVQLSCCEAQSNTIPSEEVILYHKPREI